MRVEFHPEAKSELIESAIFYENRVANLGYKFIREIEKYSLMLGEHPKIGQQIDQQFRFISVDDFPYSLIYSIEPDCVWIIAIAHQHRRPGYWKQRN